jgi:hypothetical protein
MGGHGFRLGLRENTHGWLESGRARLEGAEGEWSEARGSQLSIEVGNEIGYRAVKNSSPGSIGITGRVARPITRILFSRLARPSSAWAEVFTRKMAHPGAPWTPVALRLLIALLLGSS